MTRTKEIEVPARCAADLSPHAPLCYPSTIPNNSASAIRSALSTHLTAVSELKSVKQGRDLEFAGFPAARFYLVGVRNDPVTNAPADLRTYRFAVDIVQEANALTKGDGEAAFEDVVDAVMDKLNSKWQLPNGSNVPQVDTSVITDSSAQVVEAPFGPAVILQLILECKTLIY